MRQRCCRHGLVTLNQAARSYATESTPKKALPSQDRRRSLDFLLIGLGAAALSGVVVLSTRRSFSKQAVTPTAEATPQSLTFTIPIPSSSRSGERRDKTLTLMSPRETEAKLHEHEESFTLNRPNNPVFRFDTSWLASNSPIEDDHSVEVLSRDKNAPVQGRVDTNRRFGKLMLFAGTWCYSASLTVMQAGRLPVLWPKS
jgi:hypothetical protein